MEYLYLFVVSFISATLLPMGSEAVLLYDLTLDLNIILLFILATLANSLGSLVNYYLGLKGEEYLLQKKHIDEKKFLKAKSYFDKYGGYSLLFSWLPIVGDPITFVAGIVKYDIKKFIMLVIIAKGSRYLFIIFGYSFYLN